MFEATGNERILDAISTTLTVNDFKKDFESVAKDRYEDNQRVIEKDY